MPTSTLTAPLAIGDIEYRTVGPADSAKPPVVFVHGVLVDSSLWDGVADQLAAKGIVSFLPTWPLGSHSIPAAPHGDLSPHGVAAAIGQFLDHVEAERAILVGNDTGGGLIQLALRAPSNLIGGVVLTNCDAFEKFPPRFFKPLFRAARSPLLIKLLLAPTALRAIRHSPIAYGVLLSKPRDAELTKRWARQASEPRIRADIVRFMRAVTGDELVDSATWLTAFDRPTSIVWGTADRNFGLELAKRLRDTIPSAQLTTVDGASTFVPVSEPAAVAHAIEALAATIDS